MISGLKPIKKKNRQLLTSEDRSKTQVLEQQQRLIELQNQNISSLCGKIDQLLNCIQTQSNQKKQVAKDRRDLTIDIVIPVLPSSQRNRQRQLKKWLTSLCHEVISTSFDLFKQEKLDLEQTKAFCSENILKNILLLTKHNKFTEQDFKTINESIKKTCEYYLLKYPLAEGKEVNKKLEKEILSTNALDSNANNILLDSKVVFKYREDGIYNDLIMKFINYFLELVNLKDVNGRSRFNRFYEMFQGIFSGPQSKEWVEEFNPKSYERQYLLKQTQAFEQILKETQQLKMKNEEAQKEAEEYKNYVSSYSNYLIGRKISENTPEYSQQEIESGIMNVKSPAVLRILTKWCQQLENKYFDEDYFMEKDENIFQLKGANTAFLSKHKIRITQIIQKEKQKIIQYLEKIQQNNFENQSKNSYEKLANDNVFHILENQKVLGKFVRKGVKRLQTYVISYLNRLIHGLLKVGQQFYDKDAKMFANWLSPPQLITFFIGDLIRCKYNSKEKQVLRIYKELQTISHLHPQKFKIIRIKNRLSWGTKDILINAKFQDRIICQIQLAINSTTNSFLYSSGKFNHYLYQLKRAPFGAISEMCSIWTAYDPRQKAYEKIINKERNPQTFQHKCEQDDLVIEDLPFECHSCGRTRYKNKYILSNLKCRKCNNYWICGKCKIEELDEKTLLQKISLSSKQQFPKTKRKVTDGIPPKYGIFISIQSRQVKYQHFKTLIIDKNVYMFNKNNSKIQLFFQFKKNSEKFSEFYLRNLVFETQPSENLLQVTQSQIKKEVIAKKYLKSIYKRKRQAITLQKQDLTEHDILQIDGEEASSRIYSLVLTNNNIVSIEGLVQRFSNLSLATLMANKIENLKGVGNWTQLERLKCAKNKLVQIPDEIGACKKVTKLSFQNNSINKISKEISQLKQLQQLWLDHNQLTQFPPQIVNMKNLRYLMAPSNKISQIPENIGNLKNLGTLRISSNLLKSIPPSLTDLSNLVLLNLSSNQISQFPEGINKLKNLQKLYLIKNQLTQFPPGICQISGLVEISMWGNSIKNIPSEIIFIKRLEELYLHKNCIESIPNNMNRLKRLACFSFHLNKVKQLPEDIGEISRLVELSFSFNQIEKLPQNICKLSSLKKLWMNHNKIQKLPNNFCDLTSLEDLQMMENLIQELPPKIQNLNKLSSFHFEGNEIKIIPNEFRQLKRLQDLGFGSQQLTQIPELIFEMDHLRQLQIDGYGLQKIPQKLFLLTKLTRLNLHNNKIQEIPQEIKKLSKLKILQINGNNLKKIHHNICFLTKLIELHLQKNQLEQLPLEIYSLPELSILNISENKFKIFPADFQNLSKLRKQFFKFSKNPIERVDCLQFLMEKGSNQSQDYLVKWQENKLAQFDGDEEEDVDQT